jgi:predicted DNA-binding transcriptional regulator AlpA
MRDVEEFMTAVEVAALLGVKATWIGERARLGIIPSYKIGHYRRYLWSEIEAWVKSAQ